MPRLSKTVVDAINSAPDGDVWVWDTEVLGFGLRAQPGGRKTYVVRYRNADRIQRKMTIARCSDVPVDKARELARKVFFAVAEGKDPAADKREKKGEPVTIEELKARYMKEHAIPFKKPRSVDNDEGNWRNHVLPFFKGRKVATITKADILTLHGSLADKKATANQVLALLSKALGLAEEWGMRPQNSNPCKGVKKYVIEERELILTIEELKTLNKVLMDLVDSGEIPPAMADLVRLLMITGCRLNEIMSAEQAWVDRTRRLLILPDSKTGKRKIPLAPIAMAIVDGIPPGRWLIPGRVTGTHMTDPYDYWALIKERGGLPQELRHHDLRHTAGSLGHMNGLTQKQIATMLGHKQLSTTERYLHGFVGDNAKSAEKVAGVITAEWQ